MLMLRYCSPTISSQFTLFLSLKLKSFFNPWNAIVIKFITCFETTASMIERYLTSVRGVWRSGFQIPGRKNLAQHIANGSPIATASTSTLSSCVALVLCRANGRRAPQTRYTLRHNISSINERFVLVVWENLRLLLSMIKIHILHTMIKKIFVGDNRLNEID